MRTLLTATIFVLTSLGLASSALAMGEPEHSKVEIKTEVKNKNLHFTFKVVPDKDMKINLDGPWAFKLTGAEGLTFAKDKFARDDLDEKLTGFAFATTAPPAKDKGDLEYRLTTFICTKDATKCFREVHKAKYSWSTKPTPAKK